MKCLIIGYGSIGERHARILDKLGHDVSLVTHRSQSRFRSFKNIKAAISAYFCNYVIIANRTCDHFHSMIELINTGYKGRVLIEKPLFDKPYEINNLNTLDIFVAYNFRFHPIIQDIRDLIQDNPVYSIHAYCGQYLPDWRPSIDYTKCYSSSKKSGGGVLRDLSHELDYINWLTGGCKYITAYGGKFSHLDIDSDDVFCFLIESFKCPVISLQVNYLDRVPRRELIINSKKFTIKADLIANTISSDKEVKHYYVERDMTYQSQHEAILQDNTELACTFEQGQSVLKLIEAAERSSKERTWKKI